MTNKNNLTTNSEQTTSTKVKKRKKRSTKKSSSSYPSTTVIKNGKKVKRKKRKSSNPTHSQNLVPLVKDNQNLTENKLIELTDKPINHNKAKVRNRMKRLGLAAMLFATLGLGSTVVALNHSQQSKVAIAKKQRMKPRVITISDVPENHQSTFPSNEIMVEKTNETEEEPTVDSQEVTQEEVAVENEPIQESYEPEVVTPVDTHTSVEQTKEVPYQQPAMTLNMLGQTIYYQNGGQGSGQSIIDANSDSQASTWGGASVFSGSDGQNTHFIGHNPGAFSVIFSLSIGSKITVTDASGTPTTYTVNSICQVTDYGVDVNSGKELFGDITGTGGGERITLQSCINDDINLIVFASAS